MATDRDLEELLAKVAHIKGGRKAVLRAVEREVAGLLAGLASYKKHHWGLQGRATAKALRVADVSAPITEMGELFAVEYLSEKGDDGPSHYRHEFEDTLPILAFDKGGLLVVAGGTYIVEKRGIVG